MSLLHPFRTAIPADCWMCDPTSDGPLCADHTRQVREAATAQAQPGYGLPATTCKLCGRPRDRLKPHDCPRTRDEAWWKRMDDR